MESLNEYMEHQYQLVKHSRKKLFDYCSTFVTEDFVKPISFFGNGGSVRSLLVHVVNTYKAWIVCRGMALNTDFLKEEVVSSMKDIIPIYLDIDAHVDAFIKKSRQKKLGVTFMRNGRLCTLSPFHLFSHVITHEFHHKGQILSISRCLGYQPVDTDIIS